MTVGVGIEGQQELLSRLAHAHDGVLDLTDVNADAAQLVLHAMRTPTATGALDAANRATAGPAGWGVFNDRPYAAYVHWGTRIMRARPWQLEAARATEDSWMDQLTGHVQQLLDGTET